MRLPQVSALTPRLPVTWFGCRPARAAEGGTFVRTPDLPVRALSVPTESLGDPSTDKTAPLFQGRTVSATAEPSPLKR